MRFLRGVCATQVLGRTLSAMLACDERKARDVYSEIEEQRVALQECTFLERDTMDDLARFMRTLQVTRDLDSSVS